MKWGGAVRWLSDQARGTEHAVRLLAPMNACRATRAAFPIDAQQIKN
jgi:hypothetical protein